MFERTAGQLLDEAIKHAPETKLLGDVTAGDVAGIAAFIIDTCPRCSCPAWTNKECDLCSRCDELLNGPETEERR